MSYDPDKQEVWVISSSGFWRDGVVNKTEYMVRTTCTWEQAKNISDTMAKMYSQQYEAVRNLEEEHRVAKRLFFASFE